LIRCYWCSLSKSDLSSSDLHIYFMVVPMRDFFHFFLVSDSVENDDLCIHFSSSPFCSFCSSNYVDGLSPSISSSTSSGFDILSRWRRHSASISCSGASTSSSSSSSSSSLLSAAADATSSAWIHLQWPLRTPLNIFVQSCVFCNDLHNSSSFSD